MPSKFAYSLWAYDPKGTKNALEYAIFRREISHFGGWAQPFPMSY